MKFQPGNNANPNGRPKKPEIELFRQAIARVEAKQGTTLLDHAVTMAFKSETVLVAILKKILPDKVEDDSMRELARTFLVRAQEEKK